MIELKSIISIDKIQKLESNGYCVRGNAIYKNNKVILSVDKKQETYSISNNCNNVSVKSVPNGFSISINNGKNYFIRSNKEITDFLTCAIMVGILLIPCFAIPGPWSAVCIMFIIFICSLLG